MKKIIVSVFFVAVLVGAGCARVTVTNEGQPGAQSDTAGPAVLIETTTSATTVTSASSTPSFVPQSAASPAKKQESTKKSQPTGSASADVSGEVTAPSAEVIPTPTAPSSPTVRVVNVTARQWTFSPSTITVDKGDKVTLQIKSIDVAHGFGLPDFGINDRLEPGITTTVTFTADKTGSFSFFCSVFCGDGHSGMKGTLIVK